MMNSCSGKKNLLEIHWQPIISNELLWGIIYVKQIQSYTWKLRSYFSLCQYNEAKSFKL